MDIRATTSGSCRTGISRFDRALAYMIFITHTMSGIMGRFSCSGMLSVALISRTEIT